MEVNKADIKHYWLNNEKNNNYKNFKMETLAASSPSQLN